MHNHHIETINQRIEPLRHQIINHPAYGVIKDLEDLKAFMHHHVYAVWDFMSLLKALQTNLTCTTVPWFPKPAADTTHLINEIVLGEESDVDQEGVRKSHFVLYIDAMRQCGADTTHIDAFIERLQQTGDFQQAYGAAGTAQAIQDFVDFTFEVVRQPAHVQAGVFTFGREDLIPEMFFSIVRDIHQKFPDQVSIFKYYLDRHIEVDGDHHSNLALQMTASLCGDDENKWQEAGDAIEKALKMRIALWDAVHKQITN
jgi:hypothetical protein